MQLNILLRGQSNSSIFDGYGGTEIIRRTLEYYLGYDGITNKVNLIGASTPDKNGNLTMLGSTSFLPTPGGGITWLDSSGPGSTGPFTPGVMENSMLAHIASLPDDVRAAPTIILWMHNEGDADWAGQTTASWTDAVRYDASLVRAALGQSAATTPYLFTDVIPFDSDVATSVQSIKTGMEQLSADPDFNAGIATHTGDLNMDNPANGLPDGRVIYGGPHMDETDAMVLAGRISRTVANTFAQYALLGSPLALSGGHVDATGPQAVSAQRAGDTVLLVKVVLDSASSRLEPLTAGAAAGLGWTVISGNTVMSAVSAMLQPDGTLAIGFASELPDDSVLYYGYGTGRIAAGAADHTGSGYPGTGPGSPGEGNSVYDDGGIPIWTQAAGLTVDNRDATVLGGGIDEYGITASGTGSIRIEDAVSDRNGILFLPVDSYLKTVNGIWSFDDTGRTEAAALVYIAGLGRSPDPQAVSALRGNVNSASDTASLIPNSSEYALRYGITDNPTFVSIAVLNATGHKALPDDIAKYGNMLNEGIGRNVVLENIALSAESRIHNIDTSGDPDVSLVYEDYASMLDRVPEPDGLLGWTSILVNGLTSEGLADYIASSPEFTALHAQQNNATFVASAYIGALGRTPQNGEDSGWENALAAGVSRAVISSDIGASPESVLHNSSLTHASLIRVYS